MEKCNLRFCDRNSSEECFPIRNINDVLLWTPPSTANWSELVKPLQKRAEFCLQHFPTCRSSNFSFISDKTPKTLVCHDMKGGYLNDRFVEGHNNLGDYKFFNWSCVDIFVYFSHEFLTIPPLSWINAGHLHGTKVLGTIITEGKLGAAVWKEICSNRSMAHKLAVKIALICKYYGFDGFLVNIENELSAQDVKGPFMFFINTLQSQLKSIHPDQILIWYDAVTNSGDLEWQNCLNDNNGIFFEACDGIFLNYGWNTNKLKESASFAGVRALDVFVGIDVFGRGVFGGGGFSTFKALEVIREHGLSAAIFAPGWVHENCEENENPEKRDFKFWSLISKYLYTYGPSKLPFETYFCRGYGIKEFKDGLVVSDKPWVNQSKINYMPPMLCGTHGVEEDCCEVYYDKDGFHGGGCLLLSRKLQEEMNDSHIDWLLVCDFSSTPGKKIFTEIYFKPLNKSEVFEMDIIVTTGNLPANKTGENKINLRNHKFSVNKYEDNQINGWHMRKFEILLDSDHILGVGYQLTEKHAAVLLGCLNIYSET